MKSLLFRWEIEVKQSMKSEKKHYYLYQFEELKWKNLTEGVSKWHQIRNSELIYKFIGTELARAEVIFFWKFRTKNHDSKIPLL